MTCDICGKTGKYHDFSSLTVSDSTKRYDQICLECAGGIRSVLKGGKNRLIAPLTLRLNPDVPVNEVQIRDLAGNILGRIINLREE